MPGEGFAVVDLRPTLAAGDDDGYSTEEGGEDCQADCSGECFGAAMARLMCWDMASASSGAGGGRADRRRI